MGVSRKLRKLKLSSIFEKMGWSKKLRAPSVYKNVYDLSGAFNPSKEKKKTNKTGKLQPSQWQPRL